MPDRAGPGVWGWYGDATRDLVWRAYVWCRLGGAAIVGFAAIWGAGDHGRLRGWVIAAAIAFLAWVAATTVLRGPIRAAVERHPRWGLVEVAVGMSLVIASGPNGAFSGWTAAPIAMAAILRPGWRWLAGVVAAQITLTWAVGLALLAWGGDPTHAQNVTATRALLSPVDWVMSYGLIALLGAALRRADRQHAREEALLDQARAEAARTARRAEDAAAAAARVGARVEDTVGRPCRELHRRLAALAGDLPDGHPLRDDLARLARRYEGLMRPAAPGVRNLEELLREALALREIADTEIAVTGEGVEPFHPLGTRIREDAAAELTAFFDEAVENMLRHGAPPYLVEVTGDRRRGTPPRQVIRIAFTSHGDRDGDRPGERWILGVRARGHGSHIMGRAARALGGTTGLASRTRPTGRTYERYLEVPADRIRAPRPTPAREALSGNPDTT
ncbi:MAG: hypothetical protein U0237_19720 [Thermoleophilia bacterium]